MTTIRFRLPELEQQAVQAGKNIQFIQTAPNCVTVKYLIDFQLKLVGNDATSLQFEYAYSCMTSIAVTLLLANLKTIKLTADATNKMLSVHLNKFAQFKPTFKQHNLQSAQIVDNEIILDFIEKTI